MIVSVPNIFCKYCIFFKNLYSIQIFSMNLVFGPNIFYKFSFCSKYFLKVLYLVQIFSANIVCGSNIVFGPNILSKYIIYFIFLFHFFCKYCFWFKYLVGGQRIGRRPIWVARPHIKEPQEKEKEEKIYFFPAKYNFANVCSHSIF